MKKLTCLGLTIAMALTLLAGCGGNTTSESTGSNAGTSTNQSASTSENNSAETTLSGVVNTNGSTSMESVIKILSEAFSQENPEVEVKYSGSGSGAGVTSAIEGTADLGLASRELKAEEEEQGAVAHVVALDGVAVVVNPENAVEDLTVEQIAKIFTGEITNWSEVGGSDQEIVVINRQAGSGTRAVFEAAVLGDQESATFQEQDSSGTVAKMVSETPGAISYLAFSYFDDQTKALSVDGVAPETANVEDNSWTIWAYEHMYTALEPDEATAAFIEYMMSDEVQGSLVEENGYIPVSGMKVEKDAEGNVTEI